MSALGPNLKRAIKRRIALAVGRFLLTALDDSGTDARGRTSHQRVSGTIFKGEDPFSDIARLQDYGISSHPHPGAEGLALAVGSSRGRIVVINTDDPRHRPVGLAQGEVQIYTDEGPVLHAKRSRETEMRGTTLDAVFTALAKLAGSSLDLDATGAVNITGATVVIAGSVTIEGKAFLAHTHSGVQAGGSNTGGVV